MEAARLLFKIMIHFVLHGMAEELAKQIHTGSRALAAEIGEDGPLLPLASS